MSIRQSVVTSAVMPRLHPAASSTALLCRPTPARLEHRADRPLYSAFTWTSAARSVTDGAGRQPGTCCRSWTTTRATSGRAPWSIRTAATVSSAFVRTVRHAWLRPCTQAIASASCAADNGRELVEGIFNELVKGARCSDVS